MIAFCEKRDKRDRCRPHRNQSVQWCIQLLVLPVVECRGIDTLCHRRLLTGWAVSATQHKLPRAMRLVSSVPSDWRDDTQSVTQIGERWLATTGLFSLRKERGPLKDSTSPRSRELCSAAPAYSSRFLPSRDGRLCCSCVLLLLLSILCSCCSCCYCYYCCC